MMLRRHLPLLGAALACLALTPVLAPAQSAKAPDPAPAKRSPIVNAPAGKIEGQLDGMLRVFKGIPYALPPVGQARWKPPIPMPRWEETRTATEFGPACYQPSSKIQTVYSRGPLPDERGLPDAEYLGARRTLQRARLFLDSRRRADYGVEQGAHL